MSAENPVSPKVVAAAAGAGAGATLTAFLVWLIGAWAYGVGFAATLADDAVGAVPDQVVAMIGLVLVVIGAAIPGWYVVDQNRAVPGAVEPVTIDPPVDSAVFNGFEQNDDETLDVTEPEVEVPVSEPVENSSDLHDPDVSSNDEAPLDSRPIYGQGN